MIRRSVVTRRRCSDARALDRALINAIRHVLGLEDLYGGPLRLEAERFAHRTVTFSDFRDHGNAGGSR